MAHIAIKFEDSTDAELRTASRVAGAEYHTPLAAMLNKSQLLSRERRALIKHIRASGYHSLLVDLANRVTRSDFVRPMHQTVKDSNAGADFLNALGYTSVDQLSHYAQRTLRFHVHGDLTKTVGRLNKANRTYTQLGFKLDYKDENKYGDGRGSYDEHCYQVLDNLKLMGFMVLRWHRGEVHTRIELCPLVGK